MALRIKNARYVAEVDYAEADYVEAETPQAVEAALAAYETAGSSGSGVMATSGGVYAGSTSSGASWSTDSTVPLGGGVYAQSDYNDFLVGTEGIDFLDGGAGDDLIYGAGGHDYLYGGTGHDTIVGGTGHDWVDGGHGDDWLLGDAGDDRLHGGWGNDRLQGGAGHDYLQGDFGADVMTGGEGHDVFMVGNLRYTPETPVGVDIITDFTLHGIHSDKIDLEASLANTDFYTANSYAGTVRDAFLQGYVALVQYGTPGEPGFGTRIVIDTNGAAAGGDVFAVADLAGIAASQLNYNAHFLI